MVSVFLIDEHTIIRQGLKCLLEDASDIQVLGEAASGEEAISILQQADYQPDVILMEARLPGIGGLEAAKRLQRAAPNARILVLTTVQCDPFPSRFLDIGVMGYLTKHCDDKSLLSALRDVYHNKRHIGREVAQQMAMARFEDKAVFDKLSDRELQITNMIITGRKVPEIADDLALTQKTVNTYRYRLFNKLDIKNDVELTRLAMLHGLISEYDHGSA